MKKFVDENIKVFEGNEAEKLLETHNDRKFLSNFGIVEISKDRWDEAQRYENKSWMIDGLGAKEDHNFYNMTEFSYFDNLVDYKFNNVIELGCGPFTNIALMERKLNIKNITILDPLLEKYSKHPNCKYKFEWNKLNTPIEEFESNKEFDLVVMINVLEHCYDIPLIFTKITQMLQPGGIFIFGDVHFKQDTIKDISENAYNAGHPIRMNTKYMYEFLDGFEMIYRKEFRTYVAGRVAYEIYYIGIL